MILRKINAVLSLITAFLLLDHAIFFSIWMLSRGRMAASATNMPWILVGLTAIHAALSIIILIINRKSKGEQKQKTYFKLNIPTYIQRITGMLMIILLALHIIGSANYFQPKILHAIFQPLFFIISLAHVSVSTAKALITLGIGNAKAVKIVDITVSIICAITLVASIIGFYLCLFLGVAV